MPFWARIAAVARADIWDFAPAPSVTLIASAKPFKHSTSFITTSLLPESGGEVSAVKTNLFSLSNFLNLLFIKYVQSNF